MEISIIFFNPSLITQTTCHDCLNEKEEGDRHCQGEGGQGTASVDYFFTVDDEILMNKLCLFENII